MSRFPNPRFVPRDRPQANVFPRLGWSLTLRLLENANSLTARRRETINMLARNVNFLKRMLARNANFVKRSPHA